MNAPDNDPELARKIVAAMAAILRSRETDIGDYRAVCMRLMHAGFGSRSIDAHGEEAIERCRGMRAAEMAAP